MAMASRLWASKAASYLKIATFNRGFASVVKDLKYADSHEWAKIEGKCVTIGITDHAQDHLGDVVYVELPEVGTDVTQGSGFGAVESVKATSDINSPVSGKVVEINEQLSSSPGLVNGSPYENGWIIKVEMSNTDEHLHNSSLPPSPPTPTTAITVDSNTLATRRYLRPLQDIFDNRIKPSSPHHTTPQSTPPLPFPLFLLPSLETRKMLVVKEVVVYGYFPSNRWYKEEVKHVLDGRMVVVLSFKPGTGVGEVRVDFHGGADFQ
ncbi:unnamed protein product [Lactuca virosa]|uniref:Glycine cleavage system H protein n=1 Tax=Lactuca virosa TaxID=75947 RepID=A0AAU9LGP3_9ASTR|nr:unnamed protein product [Lactuca virosa]